MEKCKCSEKVVIVEGDYIVHKDDRYIIVREPSRVDNHITIMLNPISENDTISSIIEIKNITLKNACMIRVNNLDKEKISNPTESRIPSDPQRYDQNLVSTIRLDPNRSMKLVSYGSEWCIF